MNFIIRLKQKVRKLKAEIQVLIFAYSDRRTPFIAKLVIGLTVGYLLSPIDLVPDFIPVLGLLDDLIIVPLLITLSIRHYSRNCYRRRQTKSNRKPSTT